MLEKCVRGGSTANTARDRWGWGCQIADLVFSKAILVVVFQGVEVNSLREEEGDLGKGKGGEGRGVVNGGAVMAEGDGVGGESPIYENG